jgi:hypothetical protein
MPGMKNHTGFKDDLYPEGRRASARALRLRRRDSTGLGLATLPLDVRVSVPGYACAAARKPPGSTRVPLYTQSV